MDKRGTILIGMAAGALWALAVVWGAQRAGLAFMTPLVGVPLAMAPVGLVMTLMIGRLAQRRFFDDRVIDGDAFPPGSPGWVDQRVLSNTAEQALLALLIWPFVALTMGGQVAVVLGLAFALARLLFWIGYHLSPPLRALGFAATFYTTVLAGLWSLAVWL
ncbi:MAPEG family protein [Seohaeicola nanhaiensis]|uniref:MAPEG family protein n=1 Tax=Seohaeicola nanhaiensis TaxID=1387282 RepID=A0ABV9KD41_9RHOB